MHKTGCAVVCNGVDPLGVYSSIALTQTATRSQPGRRERVGRVVGVHLSRRLSERMGSWVLVPVPGRLTGSSSWARARAAHSTSVGRSDDQYVKGEQRAEREGEKAEYVDDPVESDQTDRNDVHPVLGEETLGLRALAVRVPTLLAPSGVCACVCNPPSATRRQQRALPRSLRRITGGEVCGERAQGLCTGFLSRASHSCRRHCQP